MKSLPLKTQEKIAITRRVVTEVSPFFETGAMRPVIDRRFAFDDIAAAHTHMASNANVGKIVIDL